MLPPVTLAAPAELSWAYGIAVASIEPIVTQPLRPSPAGRVGPGGAGGVRGTLRRN